MDRNRLMKERTINWHVALRKESVDRNIKNLPEVSQPSVALRKESVDRNTGRLSKTSTAPRSLSARRAWIEIGIGGATNGSI